jgi:hypothetical protein
MQTPVSRSCATRTWAMPRSITDFTSANHTSTIRSGFAFRSRGESEGRVAVGDENERVRGNAVRPAPDPDDEVE